MPLYQLLTDRTLAEASAITPTTLIHIVTTGDPSQNPAGSSYKAELGQLVGLFNFTGGTVSGETIFTNGLTANTFSASSIFVNGVQITGDTFVTGATYSDGTAIFTNNQGNQFNLTGLTEPFSGGSGNCITDLYVSNIHSCSPLNINPLDEGEVYFGSTSGVTIDVTNSRIGIGNSNPVTNLHVSGNTLVSGSLSASTLDLVSSNNLNTANNTLRFTDTDAGASDNQFSGKIEFYSSDVSGIGVKSYIGGVVSTSSQGSIIFGTTGTTGTLTGGTTVGERMRITSDGFVGIGQTSPTYTLDISSGNETTDDIALRVANDGNKGVYFAPTANNSSFNQNTISGDTVIVGSPGESLVIGSNTGYAGIRFSGGTGALAMTSTGWLGLGSQYLGDPTEQPSQQLDVEGNARFRAIGSVASAGALHYTSNGTLTTNTSDIRLKENIEPLTNSLEKILQLTGVTYNWIGETGKRIGMIAQDVEKVIPELVFTNNNTEEKIKGIHQDNLTSVLVEAIKEQQKIIEELKVRISNLES